MQHTIVHMNIDFFFGIRVIIQNNITTIIMSYIITDNFIDNKIIHSDTFEHAFL